MCMSGHDLRLERPWVLSVLGEERPCALRGGDTGMLQASRVHC